MKRILTIILLLTPFLSFSQNMIVFDPDKKQVDSLQAILPHTVNDTLRMFIYRRMAAYFVERDNPVAIDYHNKMLTLARKLKQSLWEAEALNELAYGAFEAGDYPQSLNLVNAGVKIAETEDSEKDLWHVKEFAKDGDPHKARLYLLALLYEKLGYLYFKTGNSIKCTSSYFKAIKVASGVNDEVGLSFYYEDLGDYYLTRNQLDSALNFSSRGLAYAKASGYELYRGGLLANIGEAYLRKKNYTSAKKYFFKSVEAYKEINNAFFQPRTYLLLADLYTTTGKSDSAIYYARLALEGSKSQGDGPNVEKAYTALYAAHKRSGQMDSAFFYLQRSKALGDSLDEVGKLKLSQYLSIGFNDQLKVQELEKDKIQVQTRIRTYAMLVGITIFIIIASILYRNNREKRKANLLLSEQKEEIEIQRDNLEQKNRELEIETALERVRTVAMGMMKPGDLLDICETMFHELKKLGFADLRNAMINVHYDDKKYLLNYDYSGDSGKTVTNFAYNSHPIVDNIINHARQSSEGFTEMIYSGKALDEWRTFRKNNGEPDNERFDNINSLYYYFYSIGNGAIGISNFSGVDHEQLNILKRFRNVFDLAYKRYIDITKAEEQAREAQIQLGLERVRARTMAMQRSGELAETAFILFQQFKELGENPDQATIGIINEEENVIEYWVTMYGSQINQVFKFSIDEPHVTNRIYKAWKKQQKSLVIDLAGQELDEFTTYRAKMGGAVRKKTETRRVINVAFFSKGLINVQSTESRSAESIRLLERFAGVFDGTYTRFLDLQKAEAQAREAQIEAALEKVRSRSLAMFNTEELGEVVNTVLEKMSELGVNTESNAASIMLFEEGSRDFVQWIAIPGQLNVDNFRINYIDHPIPNDFFDARERGADFFTNSWPFEVKNPYWERVMQESDFKNLPDELKQVVLQGEGYALSAAIGKYSAICIPNFNGNLLSEPENDILKRFGKVFEQAYIRFLDLQKAEAQAREAQIEAALERVRSKTMAMHKSDELAETAAILFRQMIGLGIEPNRLYIGILRADTTEIEFWITDEDGSKVSNMFSGDSAKNKSMKKMRDAWKEHKKSISIDMQGKELSEYFYYLGDILHVPFKGGLAQKRRVTYISYFSNGFIGMASPDEQPQAAIDLLDRFAYVFNLTYTRFLDLQKAEAQAREAQIEASLERVRSKTMAMHNSNDVGETVTLMFNELIKLGVDKIARCGIAIPDNNGLIELWTAKLSKDEKEEMIIGHLNTAIHPMLRLLYDAWKSKQPNFEYVLEGDDLDSYITALNNYPGYPIKYDKGGWGAKQYHNDFFFHEGMVFAFTSNPLSDEISSVFKRFAGVFGQTYRRFLDLQKAEAQAREAHIEAALERVRSRTMAMQKSEELAEVIQLVYDQLCQLDFNIDHANFVVNYKESDDLDLWLAVNGQRYSTKMHIPYLDHPIFNRLNEAKEKGLSFFSDSLTFEEKNTFFQHFFENAPQIPQERKEAVFKGAGYARSVVFMKTIGLSIQNCAAIPYSDAENAILTRFGKVFEQTYTRFNDLKQAEEQAREAKIEAGLERVRAKAMAMHSSENLAETISVFYHELGLLSVTPRRCGLGLMEKGSRYADISTMNTTEQGESIEVVGRLKMTGHRVLDGIYDNWLLQKEYHPVLRGNEIREYYQLIRPQISYPDYPNSVVQYGYFFYFRDGGAFAWTDTELPEDELQIYRRFTSVLSLTYRRYKDIKEAEAQAKESQIQLALERVRARTMAMQKSDELAETAMTLFQQFNGLGVKPERIFIGIIDEDASIIDFWGTEQGGDQMSPRFEVNADATVGFSQIYKAWGAKKKMHTVIMKGKELADHINYVQGILHMPIKQELVQKQRIMYSAFFSQGLLMIVTPDTQSKETLDILERFSGVFNLTYTRFNDLKQAEEQAREATIEAALERVRGKAMAMYNSADLTATASLVFTELRKLGIEPMRCGLSIQTKESRKNLLYSATASGDGHNLSLVGWALLDEHPVLRGIHDHWMRGEDYFPVLKGGQLKTYYEKLKSNFIVPPDEQSGREQFGYFIAFSEGTFYGWAEKPFSETEIKTLKRFASVIDLTYRRYIELQKSEAIARDAVRDASLDRVRAEIASMRSTEDLERITPLIWNELTILGIPFIRCGVFIVNEEAQLIHTHLSTADGKALATFDLKFDSEGIGQDVLPAWRKKQIATIHWSREEFAAYTSNLVSQGTVKSKERYVTEHPDTSLDLHFFPFQQGMLYVGNTGSLMDDEKNLVQSLADAFSTAYARYEDFNKLEAAKQQVENTLTDLKATQTKLIQSEKMASLGELTAGIAHEIQNPLNFVNNFSEVNQEMIDELEEELKAGNIEEALAIAADIKQNEEKISHHGKRADGIVKGMLQHSRTGGGEKQLTNMNTLADEFLRLSYHGLRAKDKTFNAEMVTHFDPDLPKISVIAQDMGRVMLNLFNNAFYAVNQKKKTAGSDYKPEVSVTTLTENSQLIIKVKDNGTGMPEHIKGKIMQPFFTTKPTGEGTGLGLSLTYDMVVKGHGGSIQVNSAEGEGSEFIILLPVN